MAVMTVSARAQLFACCATGALLIGSAATADTVTWIGGTGNWNDAAFWDLGVPLATDDAVVDGGDAVDSVVTVTTATTIDNLTISTGDSVSLNNALIFTLTGSLFNDGTFTVNSGGGTTSLDIVDGSTLSGNGTIVLTHPNARITGTAGAVLSNAAGHTIAGTGNIGAAQLTLDNAGLIVANQANALTLNLQSGSTSTNTGTLRAEAGRTMTLATGGSGFTVVNTGGLIEALDGAQVQLRSGIRVEGGTLATSGTGFIRLEATTLDGVTNTGLTQVSSAGARLAGTIVNDGELRLNSSGGTTTFSIEGDVRLEGSGALTATSFAANTINSAFGFDGSVLTNTVDHTIRGSGSLGAASMGLVNEGLILADQAAQLTVNLSNAVSQENRRNTGIMRAENGATLAISSTVLDNTGGLIEARGAGSFIRLDGVNTRIIGGTLNTEDDRTVVIIGGSALEDLRNDGNVRVQTANTGKLRGTIENFGEIAVASTGGTTTLEIEGDTTLTGDGQLRMTNFAANRIIGVPVTSVLTNDVDHLITGAGLLGVNNLGLINLGTIEADGSAGLTVNLNNAAGVARQNLGTMRALAGGTLTVSDTDLDNTGGTIEAQSGGTVSFTGANTRITSGVLTGDGDVDLRGSATLVDLRNEGRIAVANAQTGRIEGAIDNAGEIALESIGSQTTLTILGDTTLSGGGAVEMSNRAANRITGSPATAVLTNAADHTIRGAGQIGIAGNMGLINEGLIEAVGSAGLTVLLNTDPTVARSNTGTMRATGGATLTLGASAFDMELANAGGLIEAQDGGTVVIAGSRILGGTLDTEGTGVIDLRNSGVLSDLRNDGLVRVSNGLAGRLQGTLENFGEINLNSIGSSTQILLLGDVTLTGPGLLTGSNSTANTIFGTPSTTLTQGADHTIRGAFNIGNAGNMALNNAGVIEAQDSAGITMSLSAAAANMNSGEMRALTGSELRISSTVLDNTGGLIEAMDGGAVTITGGRIDGGRIDTDGTGVIDLVSSAILADLRNDGNVRVGNARTGRLAGAIENFGTIGIASSGSSTAIDIAEDTTLSGTGTLVMTNLANNRLSSVGGDKMLSNAAGHTIRGSGSIGIGAGSIGLTNAGLVEADGTVALTINPNATLGPVLNTGTLRASGAGGLSLTSGQYDNQGLIEAVNGSTVSYTVSGITLNNALGTLTGGRWRAAGDESTIDIRGGKVETNAAEIILSGAGSRFRAFEGTGFVALEDSLETNTGILRVLDDRDFTSTAGDPLVNEGLIELGGGSFDAPGLTNTGEFTGFGTVVPVIDNSGTVRADGGTLTANAGISGTTGTVLSEAGATLAIGTGSEAAVLQLNGGALALGGNDFEVRSDYDNTAFGVGNAFDRRANVTGTGEILGFNVAIGIGGDTTGAGPAHVLNFGNVRGGTSATLGYSAENLAPAGNGAGIRGAIQTAANGGNVTDARLSGSGVTAQNFGLIAPQGDSGLLDVTFTADGGGALSGQSLAVVTNFDNLETQTIAIEAFATQLAQGQAAPGGPIDLGNFRVGVDAPSQSFAVTNLTTGDGAESLGIASASATGSFAGTNNLGAGLVAPGATAANAAGVAVSGGVAGVNAGQLTLQYTTDGTAIDADFTAVNANAQTIDVSATGFNVAQAQVTPDPVVIANQRVGGTNAAALTVANTAAAGAFTEGLNANVSDTSGAASTNGGSIALLAGGASDSTSITASVDTTSAGARTGSVTLALESDGAGTSGFGALALGERTVQVQGNVFALAEGQLNVTSYDFGTVQVGQAVSQTLSISNVASGPAGFVEDLNAAFGASTGTGAGQISGIGSIDGLVTGTTDASSMTVLVNTSAAGTINGAIGVNYFSAGAVNGVSNGLGTLAVGSDSFAVSGLIEASGTVVDQAVPVINTATPINLGNVRVNDASPTASVSVTNQATGNDQAALNATIAGNGAVTAAGSFDLLLPGATDGSSLSVGLDTSTAGAVNGTATLGFVSDASNIGNCAPNCQMPLASQDVQVTGGVYQLAQPDLPDSVDVGNFRLGDSAAAALTIANTDTAPAGFQEGLDAAIAGTGGLATAVGGPIQNLAAGATSSAITVGIDGGAAAAGVNSGTVTLTLASNGTGTSGLGTLALPSADIAVTGTGYRTADPLLNTTDVTLVARVGDAQPSAAISVTNQSPDAFTEALDASLGAAPAGFGAAGTITGLAAQGSDAGSLSVSLDTGSAGSFGGDLDVNFTSSGAGTTGAADLALAGGTVALTGRVYAAAQGQLDTPSVDFGIVRVGDAVAAQALGVTNAAPVAALNDTLAAGFAGALGGPFGTAGSPVSGLGAGESAASLAVGLDTSAAGVFALTVDDAVAFTSQNPELADLDLGTAALTLTAQINNLVRPAFELLGGTGTLTDSGLNFLLDLGTVTVGETVGTSLVLLNDVAGPADALFGSFDAAGVDAFGLTGFDPVADLLGGESTGPLGVSFTALLEGTVSQTLTFGGFGRNAFGPDLAFDTVSLTLRATGQAPGGDPGVIPLPAAGWMLLSGLSGLAGLRLWRRRKMV